MKVEHGTYTEAHLTTANEPYTWSGGLSGAGSKIYGNGVADGGVDATFTLVSGDTIVVKLFPGTIVPLVTTHCSLSNIIILR